jgi:hypothetical protein
MFHDLKGKTIASAVRYKLDGFRDIPILKLKFTDGTHCCIQSTFGSYDESGAFEPAEDYYPRYIGRTDDIENITPIDA